jgi:hypothetical protein
MVASSLIALTFNAGAGDAQLHRLSTILIVLAVLLVVIAGGRVANAKRGSAEAEPPLREH